MSRNRRPKATATGVASLAITLAVTLLSVGASAQLTNADSPFRGRAPGCFVYHSHDGDGFYDFTRVLPLGSHTLGLWATAGATSTGEPSCEPGTKPGTGEICFVSFVIQKSGTGSLTGFTFAGGITGVSTLSPDGSTLSVNISRATNPFPAGYVPSVAPVRIGDLNLTIGSNTVVSLTGGSCLGPGAETRAVPAHTMFLPEPGKHVLLAAGLLGLAVLHRVRTTLARRR